MTFGNDHVIAHDKGILRRNRVVVTRCVRAVTTHDVRVTKGTRASARDDVAITDGNRLVAQGLRAFAYSHRAVTLGHGVATDRDRVHAGSQCAISRVVRRGGRQVLVGQAQLTDVHRVCRLRARCHIGDLALLAGTAHRDGIVAVSQGLGAQRHGRSTRHQRVAADGNRIGRACQRIAADGHRIVDHRGRIQAGASHVAPGDVAISGDVLAGEVTGSGVGVARHLRAGIVAKGRVGHAGHIVASAIAHGVVAVTLDATAGPQTDRAVVVALHVLDDLAEDVRIEFTHAGLLADGDVACAIGVLSGAFTDESGVVTLGILSGGCSHGHGSHAIGFSKRTNGNRVLAITSGGPSTNNHRLNGQSI